MATFAKTDKKAKKFFAFSDTLKTKEEKEAKPKENPKNELEEFTNGGVKEKSIPNPYGRRGKNGKNDTNTKKYIVTVYMRKEQKEKLLKKAEEKSMPVSIYLLNKALED